MNGDVVGGCAATSYYGLERVLQLGETQPSLWLTVPAAYHELIPSNRGTGRHNYGMVVENIMLTKTH